MLLAHGADATLQSRVGWTALHYAAQNGNERVVRALLLAGAKVDAKTTVRRLR